MGSFRTRLAVRFTVLMGATLLVAGAVATVLLRRTLTVQLDGTLLRLAAIEASAVSDAPDSTVHFHEGVFNAPVSANASELLRYAQIWRADGSSFLRSQSLGPRDLPAAPEGFAAAQRGAVVVVSQRLDGERVRSVFYPLGLLGPARRAFILQVAAPLRPLEDTLRTLVRALLSLGVLATGVTFIGAWWLARLAVRPAQAIAEQAEAITAGSLASRIHAQADAAEYRRLEAVLNGMLDRITSAFDAQRRFVADASHEIRHPLAVLRAGLDLALRHERSPAEYRAAITDAVEQTDRISALAEGLLTLARADAGVLNPQRKPHDLLALAEAACRRARLVADSRRLRLTIRGTATPVAVDAELIARALDNLLDNALRFTPPGGAIDVVVAPDGAAALVHVTDTGPGVPADHVPYLFERFFRGDPTRASGGGAGLGLAITRGIAEAHGGDVLYAPGSPAGSRFTLKLEP
jgi:heavy metal sensor kinase